MHLIRVQQGADLFHQEQLAAVRCRRQEKEQGGMRCHTGQLAEKQPGLLFAEMCGQNGDVPGNDTLVLVGVHGAGADAAQRLAELIHAAVQLIFQHQIQSAKAAYTGLRKGTAQVVGCGGTAVAFIQCQDEMTGLDAETMILLGAEAALLHCVHQRLHADGCGNLIHIAASCSSLQGKPMWSIRP